MNKACKEEGFIKGKLDLLSELADIKETVKTGWAKAETERNLIVAAQEEDFQRKVEELEVRDQILIVTIKSIRLFNRTDFLVKTLVLSGL